jgi:acyl-CoA oxidase
MYRLAYAGNQLRDLRALRAVFVAREGRLLGQLAAKMRGASGEAVFETWMKRESDLVQATALAYAEREVLDACLRAIEEVGRPACLKIAMGSRVWPSQHVQIW